MNDWTPAESNFRTEPDERSAGVEAHISSAASRAIKRLYRLADKPACVILLGEPNSGKTTVANTLLAGGTLPTSVIPNTRYPVLLRYGNLVGVIGHTTSGLKLPITSVDDIRGQQLAFLEISMPNPRLRDFEIVDTPGLFELGSIEGRADISPLRIPIWCTSATQAWKESERRAWMRLHPALRRRGMLAVTRLDLIPDPAQRTRLITRLQTEAGPHFRQIVSAVEMAGYVMPLTLEIAATASVLRERRQRTIVMLSKRISNLDRNSKVEMEMARTAVPVC